MSTKSIALTTPEQIQHWHILSRLYGLTLEINSNGQLRPSHMSTIKMLELEGIIPPMRNTQKNRCIVLRALFAWYVGLRPDYMPSDRMAEALI